MSHTEGKLTARGDFVCDSNGYRLWDYHYDNEANTHRIIACWNALDGVPTEWLEKYVGTGLKNIIQQNTDLIRKEEELTERLMAAEEEIAAKDKTIDNLALQKGILKAEIGRIESENEALKAEVERLRKGERRLLDESLKVKDAHATVYQKVNPGLTFNGPGTIEQAPANAATKEAK